MSISPEHATAGSTRCRACGARLRPEDEWCTLCLTRVAEDPEPSAAEDTPEEPPEDAGQAAPEDAAEVAAEDIPDDAAGRAAGDAGGEEDPEVVAAREAMAEQLLAELSATESRAVPARLAALNPGGRAGGAVLATLGGLAVLAVLMSTLAVLGRFL